MARKKSVNKPTQTIQIDAAQKAMVLTRNAVQLAEYAATALVAAEQLGITSKPLADFWLAPAQRDVLLAVPGISRSLKAKLRRQKPSFTVADIASMTMALAEALTEGEPRKQIAVLLVAKHFTDRLQETIAGSPESRARKAKEPKSKADPSTIYQFKITLLGAKPAIWRRIQVQDCTLDKLHKHIQTAMGWTNSHLHQFEIDGECYGDPELLDDGFEDFECFDSTRTKVSTVVPQTGKRLRFEYEYDFGDGWEHEILFEGCPKKEAGKKYPCCVEGERACPPEDVGGIGGFYEFLEALADSKHEQHEEMMEWRGPFDSEVFDAKKATKAMRKVT